MVVGPAWPGGAIFRPGPARMTIVAGPARPAPKNFSARPGPDGNIGRPGPARGPARFGPDGKSSTIFQIYSGSVSVTKAGQVAYDRLVMTMLRYVTLQRNVKSVATYRNVMARTLTKMPALRYVVAITMY